MMKSGMFLFNLSTACALRLTLKASEKSIFSADPNISSAVEEISDLFAERLLVKEYGEKRRTSVPVYDAIAEDIAKGRVHTLSEALKQLPEYMSEEEAALIFKRHEKIRRNAKSRFYDYMEMEDDEGYTWTARNIRTYKYEKKGEINDDLTLQFNFFLSTRRDYEMKRTADLIMKASGNGTGYEEQVDFGKISELRVLVLNGQGELWKDGHDRLRIFMVERRVPEMEMRMADDNVNFCHVSNDAWKLFEVCRSMEKVNATRAKKMLKSIIQKKMDSEVDFSLDDIAIPGSILHQELQLRFQKTDALAALKFGQKKAEEARKRAEEARKRAEIPSEWSLEGALDALGVSNDALIACGDDSDAKAALIRTGFRKSSLRAHPDKKGGSKEAMQAVNSAKDHLSEIFRGI